MRRRLLLPLLLFFTSLAAANSATESDIAALLTFRSIVDPAGGGALSSWTSSAGDPCALPWRGVSCSGDGRVNRLVFERLSLAGGAAAALASLAGLTELRVLSLKHNRLSGGLPADWSRFPRLKLLFLANNSISGEIPSSIGDLSRLYRLDLSSNNLTGAIPPDLRRLDRLLTLRLDSNRLSGSLAAVTVSPSLQDFNVSHNLLTGEIPKGMSSFPASAFAGNAALCGPPLTVACKQVLEKPGGAELPPVASSSTSVMRDGGGRKESSLMSHAAVIAIVAGDIAVIGIVAGILGCYFWRKFAAARGRCVCSGREVEKIGHSSNHSDGGDGGGDGAFQRGKMVFLDNAVDRRRFQVEELLRASAEMLGKGGYGTAYRAMLQDGTVVAVKRLREMPAVSRREFEKYMLALGRIRHSNIVPLTAYYYTRDERLLVYEFMANGSLHDALHGNRGPGRTVLDWTARVRIALGAARGLAHLHSAARTAHGNVKPSNILLDKAGNARLADYGVAAVVPIRGTTARSSGYPYLAPEAPGPGRPWATPRGDVYAFGVVLLEMLTGRPAAGGHGVDLPRWVSSVVREEWTAEVFDLELMRHRGIEGDMVALLRLALACAVMAPERRPKMGSVVKAIEEIRVAGDGGAEGSSSHWSRESAPYSSTVSDAGATASQ